MDFEEAKEGILSRLEFSTKGTEEKGGQSVGSIQRIVVVESSELGIKIEISYHRSIQRNKEVGIQMFENIIDSLM